MQITKTELKNMITEAVEAALSKRKLSEAKKNINTDSISDITIKRALKGCINEYEPVANKLGFEAWYQDVSGELFGKLIGEEQFIGSFLTDEENKELDKLSARVEKIAKTLLPETNNKTKEITNQFINEIKYKIDKKFDDIMKELSIDQDELDDPQIDKVFEEIVKEYNINPESDLYDAVENYTKNMADEDLVALKGKDFNFISFH